MKKLILLGIILISILLTGCGTSKQINECRDLCACGSEIPYELSACKSDCSQIYYYGGEEGLNKYIQEMRKDKCNKR